MPDEIMGEDILAGIGTGLIGKAEEEKDEAGKPSEPEAKPEETTPEEPKEPETHAPVEEPEAPAKPAEEPVKVAEPVKQPEPVADDEFAKLVNSTKATQSALEKIDADIKELEDKFDNGQFDAFDDGPKLAILTNRRTRLERELASVSAKVETVQKNAAEAAKTQAEKFWNDYGETNKDIAGNASEAAKFAKEAWAAALEETRKKYPNGNEGYIVGRAESLFETKIAMKRAESTKTSKTKPVLPSSKSTVPANRTDPMTDEEELQERLKGKIGSWDV